MREFLGGLVDRSIPSFILVSVPLQPVFQQPCSAGVVQVEKFAEAVAVSQT